MGASDVVEEFVLESAHGGARLRFSRMSRLGSHESCEYRVQLAGGGVQACADVYDLAPHHWGDLFEDLARHWRGWQGTKEHESLERQLEIICTCDRTGHVELRVTLRGHVPDEWMAVDPIHLEAGQLEEIGARARAYFG